MLVKHSAFFSHPDYTVGMGFSPNSTAMQFTDLPHKCITVGRESAFASPCPEEFPYLIKMPDFISYKAKISALG